VPTNLPNLYALSNVHRQDFVYSDSAVQYIIYVNSLTDVEFWNSLCIHYKAPARKSRNIIFIKYLLAALFTHISFKTPTSEVDHNVGVHIGEDAAVISKMILVLPSAFPCDIYMFK